MLRRGRRTRRRPAGTFTVRIIACLACLACLATPVSSSDAAVGGNSFEAWAVGWAVRTLALDRPGWVRRLPEYSVGSLGAFWTIQRVVIMWGG